jgi:hypothetical protein
VIILHLFSDGQAFSFLLSIYLSLYIYGRTGQREVWQNVFVVEEDRLKRARMRYNYWATKRGWY